MTTRSNRGWVWIGAGALGAAALVRWQLARWFTPAPRYDVEQRLGELEVRVYGPHWVAETTVSDASWDQALDEGFRRLAAYIFGDNRPSPFQPSGPGKGDPSRPPAAARSDDGQRSGYVIPMPTPVIARPKPRRETIAMTTPVNVSTDSDRSYTVAFNLPDERTLETLPAPNDERVRLERKPRRRVAVLRYGGRHTGPRVAEKFSELLARVRAAGLGYRGSPEFAGYDPPSTLPLLRRNEVWVELEPA
jgi:hypothetical protein